MIIVRDKRGRVKEVRGGRGVRPREREWYSIARRYSAGGSATLVGFPPVMRDVAESRYDRKARRPRTDNGFAPAVWVNNTAGG